MLCETPLPKKDQRRTERRNDLGFPKGQPSPQRLPLARGSMLEVGAAALSAKTPVWSDRQPDVGAVDFFFHARRAAQQRASFRRVQQLVVAGSGLPLPKQVWSARELDEALNHGAASWHAAYVLGISSRTFP